MYNPILNKAVSKLNDRPALKYVHQNPNNGEFIASDGVVMLIENNNAPPGFGFCVADYPNYEQVLNFAIEETNRDFKFDKIKYNKGFATFGMIRANAKYIPIIKDFIGESIKIKISERRLYFYNSDKSKQAVLMAIMGGACPDGFKVIDSDSNELATFETLEEAELMLELLGGAKVIF